MPGREHPYWVAVVSFVTLLVGAICFITVALDIALYRRKNMMGIMMVVYPINMLYWGPLGVWAYWQIVVRPSDAKQDSGQASAPACHQPDLPTGPHPEQEGDEEAGTCCSPNPSNSRSSTSDGKNGACHSLKSDTSHQKSLCQNHHAQRPMWQSVAVSVAHCGAGCVLGDIVADWIIYGAGLTIAGRAFWVEMVLGYGLALVFGIAFQYLNIAPMTGEWGLSGFIKAMKADILSLTSFEVGLFGWMAIYNLTFFRHPELTPVSSIYWFMMQIGMLFGKATASPTNFWLVKTGIKQPCA